MIPSNSPHRTAQRHRAHGHRPPAAPKPAAADMQMKLERQRFHTDANADIWNILVTDLPILERELNGYIPNSANHLRVQIPALPRAHLVGDFYTATIHIFGRRMAPHAKPNEQNVLVIDLKSSYSPGEETNGMAKITVSTHVVDWSSTPPTTLPDIGLTLRGNDLPGGTMVKKDNTIVAYALGETPKEIVANFKEFLFAWLDEQYPLAVHDYKFEEERALPARGRPKLLSRPEFV